MNVIKYVEKNLKGQYKIYIFTIQIFIHTSKYTNLKIY